MRYRHTQHTQHTQVLTYSAEAEAEAEAEYTIWFHWSEYTHCGGSETSSLDAAAMPETRSSIAASRSFNLTINCPRDFTSLSRQTLTAVFTMKWKLFFWY